LRLLLGEWWMGMGLGGDESGGGARGRRNTVERWGGVDGVYGVCEVRFGGRGWRFGVVLTKEGTKVPTTSEEILWFHIRGLSLSLGLSHIDAVYLGHLPTYMYNKSLEKWIAFSSTTVISNRIVSILSRIFPPLTNLDMTYCTCLCLSFAA